MIFLWCTDCNRSLSSQMREGIMFRTITFSLVFFLVSCSYTTSRSLSGKKGLKGPVTIVDTGGDDGSDFSDSSGDTSSDFSDTSGDTSSDFSDTSGDTSSDFSDTSGDTSSDFSDTSGDTSSDFSDSSGDTFSTTGPVYHPPFVYGLFASSTQLNSITVNWNYSGDADWFYVAIAEGSTPPACTSGPSTYSTSYTFSGLNPDTSYAFSVCAYNYEFSEYSNVITTFASTKAEILPQFPSLPFRDGFGRRDSDSIGISWEELSGDLELSNYEISASHGTALVNGLYRNNVYLETDYNVVDSNASVSLIGRYQNNNYMYLGQVHNTGSGTVARIVKMFNGVQTVLASVNVSNIGNLGFDIAGGNLRLYINGSQVTSAYDISLLLSGRMGIFVDSYGVADNFYAQDAKNEALISFDDFSRADGTNMGVAWKEEAGDMGLYTQRAAAFGFGLMTINGISIADVNLETDYNLFGFPGQGNDAYAGLVARYSGPSDNNMVLAQIVKTTVFATQIYVIKNGIYTLLKQKTLSGDKSTGKLRFEVKGCEMKVYVNGTLEDSVTDCSIQSPGKIGLRGFGNTAMDNFKGIVPTVVFNSEPVLYSDSFSRPDGEDLGTGWTEDAPNSYIYQQRAGIFAFGIATANYQALADVTVEAKYFLFNNDSGVGLVARYSGPGDNNMYLAQVAVGPSGAVGLQMYRIKSGVYTLLSQDILPGKPLNGTLRFKVVGSQLSAYLNGTLIRSVTDTQITGAGKTGFRGYQNASVDDFMIFQ